MTWQEKEEKFGKPLVGELYICKLQHAGTENIITEVLRAVFEDDCAWIFADDNSELDEWNWDVIEWKPKPYKPQLQV